MVRREVEICKESGGLISSCFFLSILYNAKYFILLFFVMTEKMTPEEALETIASLKTTNKKLKKENEESLKNSFIVYACVVVFLWIVAGFTVAKRTAMGRGL